MITLQNTTYNMLHLHKTWSKHIFKRHMHVRIDVMTLYAASEKITPNNKFLDHIPLCHPFEHC